jgi:excisionase family DNA binding protein
MILRKAAAAPHAGTSQGQETVSSLDLNELLTPDELCERLKMPRSWVYEKTRKRSSQRLPGFKLGKYWRFREEDVLAWLERQRRGIESRG